MTKLINLVSRGQPPSFRCPNFLLCFAYSAEKDKRRCTTNRRVILLAWQINAVLKALYMQLLNNEKAGLLQIYFKKAFKSITKSSLLDAVQILSPALAPFASLCYSQPSKLFFKSIHIQSQSGNQQRDPLGRLLFSLAFSPITKELDNKLPNLMQNSWYLVDEIIAGTEEELC